eukprot:5156852-Pyramimonas_sp.AAC.1
MPTLLLVRQTLGVWQRHCRLPSGAWDWLVVCSDPTVDAERDGGERKVTTDAAEVARFLQGGVDQAPRAEAESAAAESAAAESAGHCRLRVVFCTYRSAARLAEAQERLLATLGSDHRFDLAVLDEAHHTATRTEAAAAVRPPSATESDVTKSDVNKRDPSAPRLASYGSSHSL